MREPRLLIVLATGVLALAGCARYSAPQYLTIDPASGQQVAMMPQPAPQSAPMAQQPQPVAPAPRERGLFTPSPPPAAPAQVPLAPQLIQVPRTP